VKRYVFEVEDNVTRRATVLAGNVEEAREKLEEWDIEDEWVHGFDMDIPNAELIDEEELDA